MSKQAFLMFIINRTICSTVTANNEGIHWCNSSSKAHKKMKQPRQTPLNQIIKFISTVGKNTRPMPAEDQLLLFNIH